MIGTRALGRRDEDHARGALGASHTGVRPATSWRRPRNLPFNFWKGSASHSFAMVALSALEGKSLGASRRPGTHLAAFSSVDIRPGIPPSSALRCTHLNVAKRQGTSLPGH